MDDKYISEELEQEWELFSSCETFVKESLGRGAGARVADILCRGKLLWRNYYFSADVNE